MIIFGAMVSSIKHAAPVQYDYFSFFVGAGKLPNVEIRKLGSKGLVQEVYVQKEQVHPALYEKTVQFDGYSLRKARTSLDSAFKLDSAEGHIERSNEADASLNIYAYGVWFLQ